MVVVMVMNCVRDVRVIGVKHLDKYQGCLKCRMKLISYDGDTIDIIDYVHGIGNM